LLLSLSCVRFRLQIELDVEVLIFAPDDTPELVRAEADAPPAGAPWHVRLGQQMRRADIAAEYPKIAKHPHLFTQSDAFAGVDDWSVARPARARDLRRPDPRESEATLLLHSCRVLLADFTRERERPTNRKTDRVGERESQPSGWNDGSSAAVLCE
jgi:hypothetical protein